MDTTDAADRKMTKEKSDALASSPSIAPSLESTSDEDEHKSSHKATFHADISSESLDTLTSTNTPTPPANESSEKTTDSAKEEGNFEDNATPPRRMPQAKGFKRRGTLSSSLTSLTGGVDWREKTNLSIHERLPEVSTRQHAEVDDEEGKAQFFLTLLFQRCVQCYAFFCLS